jgi:quercetin dioxygenase-like cupin family protein
VSPSIASMEKIADALGVTLGEFFAAAAAGARPLIVRVEDRLLVTSRWSHGSIEALSAMSSRRMAPVLMMLEPSGRSAKHPVAHQAEEFAYVLAGRPTLTLGPEQQQLRPGDAVTIRAGELRRWENRGRTRARILIVSAR